MLLVRSAALQFSRVHPGAGNLNIACLAQDRTGYLWVGTQNGLYRYDGSQFKSYGAADGLPERMIQNLFVGLDGTLWVATTTSIFFEQRDGSLPRCSRRRHCEQIVQRTGTVFTANRPDQVVAATRSGAILLRRDGADQWIAESMGLESGDIFGVLYGPDGALWYGCDSDLCRLANGKTTRHEALLSVCPKNNGRVCCWRGTGTSGFAATSTRANCCPAEGAL